MRSFVWAVGLKCMGRGLKKAEPWAPFSHKNSEVTRSTSRSVIITSVLAAAITLLLSVPDGRKADNWHWSVMEMYDYMRV